jgi:hypothetical protein
MEKVKDEENEKMKYIKTLPLLLCVLCLTDCQKSEIESIKAYDRQTISEGETSGTSIAENNETNDTNTMKEKEANDTSKIYDKEANNTNTIEEKETSDTGKIEENTQQETYISQSESQENIPLIERSLQEQWEDAYRSIICDVNNILADPYELRDPYEYYYIGIHDFDDNGVPELIIGDIIAIAIFTYENNRVKKIADLYEPEDWGGINGLHLNDNMLFLASNGSDGSGYVGFTYQNGEYVTGVYDDYRPEVATINEEKVSGEEFRQLFNLTEFIQGKNIKRVLFPEGGHFERIKIEADNKETLIIKEEKIDLDDLDFGILQW